MKVLHVRQTAIGVWKDHAREIIVGSLCLVVGTGCFVYVYNILTGSSVPTVTIGMRGVEEAPSGAGYVESHKCNIEKAQVSITAKPDELYVRSNGELASAERCRIELTFGRDRMTSRHYLGVLTFVGQIPVLQKEFSVEGRQSLDYFDIHPTDSYLLSAEVYPAEAEMVGRVPMLVEAVYPKKITSSGAVDFGVGRNHREVFLADDKKDRSEQLWLFVFGAVFGGCVSLLLELILTRLARPGTKPRA
jgi:hypothetical protein